MYNSPRTRRLHNDLAALDRLRAESSVFRFSTSGDPPQQYQILFHGKGLCRERSKVKTIDHHRVEIKLLASYPRNMPEIRWVTPIYHPNISEIGMVCLGGYGTHWVPSLQLDELCIMLWDMVRYHNYDIRSPYNREAALWVAGQTTFRFPTDPRPLRDLRASLGRVAPNGDRPESGSDSARTSVNHSRRRAGRAADTTPVARVLQFIDRYGRIFGNTDAPESKPGNDNLVPRASRPELDYIRQLISRTEGPSAAPVVPQAERAEQTAEVVPRPQRETASPEAPRPTFEVAAQEASCADTNHRGLDAKRDDLVILETIPGTARPDTTTPGGEEIIFIE